MKYFKRMIGENVYLSPINVDDYETYTKWMNNNEIIENLTIATKLTSLESEKEWLTNITRKGDYEFAIVKKENDELIGNCGFNRLDLINQTATLGIFIGEKENHCKGYGSEALNLLLQYGFNYLNLNNIMLNVYSFNEKAINCYKKVGFKEMGRRRESYYLKGKKYDIIYMDILKREFQTDRR